MRTPTEVSDDVKVSDDAGISGDFCFLCFWFCVLPTYYGIR